MKAADLPLLTSVSTPAIHPDGGRAVVSVVRPDFAADDYVGQIWIVPLEGAERPRLLTRGHRDTAPRFSPDGRLLAFLRSGPAIPAQLYVMPSGGGEPVPATAAVLGVTEFCWSPGSTSLAYIAREPEHGRYGTVPGLSAESEPPRIVTTLHYRSNGTGFVADRRAHVFLVRAPDPWAEPVPAVVPSAAVSAEPGAAFGLPPGTAASRRLTGEASTTPASPSRPMAPRCSPSRPATLAGTTTFDRSCWRSRSVGCRAGRGHGSESCSRPPPIS